MDQRRRNPIHNALVRLARSGSEWLIARGWASPRLRWRVNRLEQRGFGSLIDLFRISYPNAIITVNVIMMLLVLVFSQERPSGAGNLGRVSGLDSYRFGAAFTVSILRGEYWRLLTAIFLHGDFMHLIFNCVALIIIGPRIQVVYGPRRFLVLYLLTGVAGNAASVFVRAFMGESILLVGASGSIFGLLGAGAIYGAREGGPRGDAIFKFMMMWILIGIGYSLLVRGDNMAHIGGALAGGLFAQVVRPDVSVSYHRDFWVGMEIGCLLVSLFCFILMVRSLFSGVV